MLLLLSFIVTFPLNKPTLPENGLLLGEQRYVTLF